MPELQLYLSDDVTAIWHAVQRDLDDVDAPAPYWAFAWVGGQAVARYLLDHPEEVADRRVVDFATGSGLCAIAAMRAGAIESLAVDIAPFSPEAVALNAWANRVQVAFAEATPDTVARAAADRISTGNSAAISLLDTDPAGIPWVPDLILAGDVCYEQPMASRVLAWLERAHAGGIRVLIGDPGRSYFRRDGLIQLADYQVPTTRDIEDRELKWAGVFTFPARE